MTDKKKPAPSMKVAAATQKITQAELEALLKSAQASKEGVAEDDDSDDDLDAAAAVPPAGKSPNKS